MGVVFFEIASRFQKTQHPSNCVARVSASSLYDICDELYFWKLRFQKYNPSLPYCFVGPEAG
jgi:hypothetical protein